MKNTPRFPMYAWVYRGRSILRLGERACIYYNADAALSDERQIQELARRHDREIHLITAEVTRSILRLGPNGRLPHGTV